MTKVKTAGVTVLVGAGVVAAQKFVGVAAAPVLEIAGHALHQFIEIRAHEHASLVRGVLMHVQAAQIRGETARSTSYKPNAHRQTEGDPNFFNPSHDRGLKSKLCANQLLPIISGFVQPVHAVFARRPD